MSPRYRTLLVALVAALAAGTIPLAGLEGPIGDAISRRHGTGPLPDGYDFLPPLQCTLSKLPDYVLFKGSPENVVVAGHFDNEWRLPAAESEKLKGAGVVTGADVVPAAGPR